MPLQNYKVIYDEDIKVIYPKEVFEAFKNYFNNLYQSEVVYADAFVIDEGDKSHLDLTVYVPGELTRDDFLDDLADFTEDYPEVKAEIIKRWPKEEKQSKQGISMAKSAKAAYQERTSFEKLKPEELEVAKKLFFEEYGRQFNEEDEFDKEDIVLLFNEKQKENQEWYPAQVRLTFKVGKFDVNKEKNIDFLSDKNIKNSKKVKDSDEIEMLIKLMGEAHSKIIEALDLAQSLEQEDKISSRIVYELEDIEAPLSDLDFEGEDNPKEVFFEQFGKEDW